MFVPFNKNEDELPDCSTLHVVKVHEEEAQPDARGDVALEHDHGEQDTTKHCSELRCAE